MQFKIDFTVKGSRADVTNQIGQHIRQTRARNPTAGAALYAVRDHALTSIGKDDDEGASEHDVVEVRVVADVLVSTTITPAPTEAPDEPQ